jgi:hypothetical protein
MASDHEDQEINRVEGLRLAAGSKKSYASGIRMLSAYLQPKFPKLIQPDGEIDLEALEPNHFKGFCVLKQKEGRGHSALSVRPLP